MLLLMVRIDHFVVHLSPMIWSKEWPVDKKRQVNRRWKSDGALQSLKWLSAALPGWPFMDGFNVDLFGLIHKWLAADVGFPWLDLLKLDRPQRTRLLIADGEEPENFDISHRGTVGW